LARAETSIEINASPEKIWSILVQLEKMPEFFESIKKVEWTSKDKNKVGSTFHAVGEALGTKMENDYEIAEMIENEKLTFRTTSGHLTAILTTTLTPTKNGTKITITQDYELPYSILGKIIDKLAVHRAMQKETEGALKKLKAMAEK